MKHTAAISSGREDGVALVSVLCLLTTAGLLVSALVAVSRISTLNVASFTDLMRSSYVAEGAANRIRYLIEADRHVFGDQDAQNIDFDEYEYDANTLSGWVIEQVGEIPKEGEKFRFENLSIEIIRATEKKVLQVKVTVLPEESPEKKPKSDVEPERPKITKENE